MSFLNIGVAGLGTVGASLVDLLEKQQHLLSRRCGHNLKITNVSARQRSLDRGLDLSGITWCENPLDILNADDVDVICELIGGDSGIALDLSRKALSAGKHLVTANKAMLAVHGNELARLAEENEVQLRYEAAIAGGIPIIKSIREGLSANSVSEIQGILNGTCNYILTKMYDAVVEGEVAKFDEVLKEAQNQGYAESDPSTDIDGIDAAHKLSILTSLAFGAPVDFDSVHIEGIRHISDMDVSYASELGYRVKLLAIARKNDGGIEQRVHPCLIPSRYSLARVDGVNNAIVVKGNTVGTTIYEGPGAGGDATASAVISDIVDIARGQFLDTFNIPLKWLQECKPFPINKVIGAYYLRLMVLDQPGVIADITACLREQNVSVESMIQRPKNSDDIVPVVLTTHQTEEETFQRALKAISRYDVVVEDPMMIRIEDTRE